MHLKPCLHIIEAFAIVIPSVIFPSLFLHQMLPYTWGNGEGTCKSQSTGPGVLFILLLEDYSSFQFSKNI